MKPGDEVICVKDYTEAFKERAVRRWNITLPVVGDKYTVRDYCKNASDRFPSILLVEIKNGDVQFGYKRRGEASFKMAHFRVVTKGTTEATTDTFAKFTSGAPDDSVRWDNRKRKVRVRERHEHARVSFDITPLGLDKVRISRVPNGPARGGVVR